MTAEIQREEMIDASGNSEEFLSSHLVHPVWLLLAGACRLKLQPVAIKLNGSWDLEQRVDTLRRLSQSKAPSS